MLRIRERVGDTDNWERSGDYVKKKVSLDPDDVERVMCSAFGDLKNLFGNFPPMEKKSNRA